MEYIIGVLLAVFVCGWAALAGFDRDRVFYPTLLMPIATYYILFAVMGGSRPALVLECAAAILFLITVWAGFKWNLWVVAAGLAGHGVFDLFHPMLIANPGVPPWWPGFCMAFDVLAGAALALLLVTRSESAPPRA